MKKKKVVLHTDYSLAKTGFGRNARAILSHLWKTGKYDLVHYCCNYSYSNPELQKTPWKTVGCLPDNPQETHNYLNSFRPEERDYRYRQMNYGDYMLDRVILEERPDVYIATQDIWGINYAVDRFWFKNISSVLWTTLDSRPLLQQAIDVAPKTKHYWMWSNFATKDMHALGHKHVSTVHGAIDERYFHRLPDEERLKLRTANNIPQNAFIIGFVFRNQLRKSVPNLLEGYSIWKKKRPNIKSYLLLHTNFSEGWPVHDLAKEYGVPLNEILTTHVCHQCKNYEVKEFKGQHVDCRFCGTKGVQPCQEHPEGRGQQTTNILFGVSESHLNEVYNLMDVYCHPFTSGGQEIPIQEAKFAELITLVTNYSCGEEMCEPEAGSIPLEWNEYRENGTNFRKASTCPKSIAAKIDDVFLMSPTTRATMGKKARQWALDNFSVEGVGKQIEAFLDSCPLANYDFVEKQNELKNPDAQIPSIQKDSQWLIQLYKDILKMEVDEKDAGHKYWMEELKKGAPRQQVEAYFRQEATKENKRKRPLNFEDLLDKDDAGKRILFVIPESIGDVFNSTSLFPSIKKQYPEYNLYVATKPENFDILSCNPHIHRVLEYFPQMDNQIWLEGAGAHKGFFELAFLPYGTTQRFLTYLHNGKTRIAFDLQDK
jgi:glycosyltransferase involved in cell wall biosynthesis